MISAETKTFAKTHDRTLVLVLCLTAAVRVFVFSAAFPFFSNVDEYLHFDIITQYSHIRLPRSFDRLTEETLNWIVPYSSPEFLFAPEQFSDGKIPPPLWKQTGPDVWPQIEATKAIWSSEINFESSQPPPYYIVASLWWRLGKTMGLTGIQSLYWIRFLNVPLIATMVWIGYVSARTIAPERVDLRIGVPLLLAFFPQGVFYAINNDVLSPLCFGALFLCMLQWLRAETASLSLALVTGLAVAAAYLTKLSNLPLIAVTLVAIIVKLVLIIRRIGPAGLPALVALVVCAAIPIGSWMVWSEHQFGDPTGSTAKIMLLGWTRKPLNDWLRHPIFTPHGLWMFWSNLISSFWRGEVSWHGRSLTWGRADGFFAVSSLILLGSAIVGLLRRTGLSTFQRQTLGISILIFVAGIVFLALLSIQFDFGNSIGPTRAYPYFTAGRLLSGALIPFALWYVYGIAFVMRLPVPWLRRTVMAKTAALPLVVLTGVVAFLATSEMLVNHVAFASEHNWFHR